MSRHDASFGQLLSYVSREASDPAYTIRHNIYGQSLREVLADFEANARHLKSRKNGTTMFHEILSIKRAKGVPEVEQKRALIAIADRYIGMRASNNLVYGVVHDDKIGHLHVHFIISANEVGSVKRHRLDKQQFAAIKTGIEGWALTNYPQLQQAPVMNKRAAKKLSTEGGELKRRTGKTPKRESVEVRLKAILDGASDKAECFARMQAAGLEFYTRGTTVGVRDTVTGRKHRMATLGLMPEFLALSGRIEGTERKAAMPPRDRTLGHRASSQQVDAAARINPLSPPQHATQSPTPSSEANVNIFEGLMHGLSVIADVASIAPNTVAPAQKDQASATTERHGSGDNDTRFNESEVDRIARERQAELEGLADQRSRERTLKR